MIATEGRSASWSYPHTRHARAGSANAQRQEGVMNILGLEIDPLALTAIGFLVVVLGLSGGLGIWVIAQMGKNPGEK